MYHCPIMTASAWDVYVLRISEQNFWCNYFYRVFLIKQSSQLATLSAGRVTRAAHLVLVLIFGEKNLFLKIIILAGGKITLQEHPMEEEKRECVQVCVCVCM